MHTRGVFGYSAVQLCASLVEATAPDKLGRAPAPKRCALQGGYFCQTHVLYHRSIHDAACTAPSATTPYSWGYLGLQVVLGLFSARSQPCTEPPPPNAWQSRQHLSTLPGPKGSAWPPSSRDDSIQLVSRCIYLYMHACMCVCAFSSHNRSLHVPRWVCCRPHPSLLYNNSYREKRSIAHATVP